MIPRRTPIKRSTHRIPRTGVKRKPRPKSETLRIYGGKKRTLFVKGLACIACGYQGWMVENAHIESGGTGRKADADKIVPLCGPHHRFLHTWGRYTFEKYYELDLAAEAARTEQKYQSFLEGK